MKYIEWSLIQFYWYPSKKKRLGYSKRNYGCMFDRQMTIEENITIYSQRREASEDSNPASTLDLRLPASRTVALVYLSVLLQHLYEPSYVNSKSIC
jgi:hypothetical protein